MSTVETEAFPAVPRFWLGTHQPSWLTQTDVPLCVSYRRLARRRTLPKALGPWMLDSGGFSELSLYGTWRTPVDAYAEMVARCRQEVGRLEMVAPQDWMCEPEMIARTGLSVCEHQERTVASVLELRAMLPGVPVIPVVQGWTYHQYLRCIDLYHGAGIDLTAEPVVGVGSICRRPNVVWVCSLLDDLARAGLRLHAFGFKITGLRLLSEVPRVPGGVVSADSLAWSVSGTHEPGCSPTHSHEGNCLRYALAWREQVAELLHAAGRPR